MLWFGKKFNKRRLEMISAMRPTSKATLKMQCLMVCKGDIDEAMKLYDYFAKDMPDLPDYDRPQPTLQQAYQFVQQVIANKGVLPAVAPEPPAEPLPPIN